MTPHPLLDVAHVTAFDAYLADVGTVFRTFADQDSGCVSYGVLIDGRKWFAKSASTEVLADEDCRRIWDSKPELVSHRDGHVFRLNISRFDHQDIEVVSQVLYPAAFPDLRFVAITWLGSREDPGAEAARRSPSAARGSGSRLTPPQPTPGTPPRPYWALDSFEAARSLAGSSPVDLPALSEAAGRGTRLTADFSGRNVIWATSEAGGTVAFEDLSTQEALARIPLPALTEGARREYQNLLRSTLAPDGPTAARQIDELLIPHRAAIDLLMDLGSQLNPTRAAPSHSLSTDLSHRSLEDCRAAGNNRQRY